MKRNLFKLTSGILADAPSNVTVLCIGGRLHIQFAPNRMVEQTFETGKQLVEYCNTHKLSVRNKDLLLVKHSLKLKY